jgi:pimeloyl-ACP methyl ester carboxylesterase
VSQEAAALMQAGEQVTLPGAGHFTWVERPELTRAAIAQFIARTRPAAPTDT